MGPGVQETESGNKEAEFQQPQVDAVQMGQKKGNLGRRHNLSKAESRKSVDMVLYPEALG